MPVFKDADEYLRMYPKLRKWINECKACHYKGHKPEMPEDISPWPSIAGYNLRRYFHPLELDDDGLCEQCRNASQD